MQLINDFNRAFKNGSMLKKLLLINLAVFIATQLIFLATFLFNIPEVANYITRWFSLPADVASIAVHPWTLISYMFLHTDFYHILFNLVTLYIFGKLFLSYLSPRQLLGVYISGGLAGAFLYVLAFNIFPAFAEIRPDSYALGASASIMAILVAISFYVPNMMVNLFLVWPVRIKYIAFAIIVLDLFSIRIENPGGHIAHLGGVIFGYLFILQLRKGKDLSQWLGVLTDKLASIFKPKPKIKVTYKRPVSDIEYNTSKVERQKETDRILDKIAKNGYESLTREEKSFLFDSSKK